MYLILAPHSFSWCTGWYRAQHAPCPTLAFEHYIESLHITRHVIECFFNTSEGQFWNNTVVVEARHHCERIWGVRQQYPIEGQLLVGWEGLGMLISRRPNKRASTEKAPGPSSAMAIHITNASIRAILELRKAQCGGRSHEIKIVRLFKASNVLAAGVKKPTSKAAPALIKSSETVQASTFKVPPSERYMPPPTIAVRPIIDRIKRSPTPGEPPGNVENRRCRPTPFGSIHPSSTDYFVVTPN